METLEKMLVSSNNRCSFMVRFLARDPFFVS